MFGQSFHVSHLLLQKLRISPPSCIKTSCLNKSLTDDTTLRYAVAEWYEAGLCDREVAGSTPARGCCVPTPTQRAIPPGSVNE